MNDHDYADTLRSNCEDSYFRARRDAVGLVFERTYWAVDQVVSDNIDNVVEDAIREEINR